MTTKQILILKSSPRKRANSSILADQVAAGARDAGATVESFDLHSLNIRPCDACDFCQDTTECVINDDMQMLYPKLRAADAIVVASPIYWFTLSAQAKLCIDRWYALEGPDGSALAGKQFGLALTYGDVDPYTSGSDQRDPNTPGHVPLHQGRPRRDRLRHGLGPGRDHKPAEGAGTRLQVGAAVGTKKLRTPASLRNRDVGHPERVGPGNGGAATRQRRISGRVRTFFPKGCSAIADSAPYCGVRDNPAACELPQRDVSLAIRRNAL